MYNYLDSIKKPCDVKSLTNQELLELSSELRDFLITSVSQTGGHLASNLGVVELTLAIYKAFDLPEDKVVWDVGHQTYVHKILTGRKDEFKNLRKLGGISGFPKTTESEYDAFNTGHSSTSISAALGMMKAKKLAGEKGHVIAVIGDGAMTGGMAYEALNAAGDEKENFIVILNDNEMSISKNVGSLSNYLTRLRSKPTYFRFKSEIERLFVKIPVIGRPIVRGLKSIKDAFRHLLTPKTLFENLGFTYLGPIDGHNIKMLTHVLESAKLIKAPVLIHVVTKKGKGYSLAETMPTEYHGVSAVQNTGKKDLPDDFVKNYSDAFGRALVSLAEQNDKVCAVTAAMLEGTGLKDFSQKFPKRFFDVAIAEQHAVTFAAGLAKGGFKPIFVVYSSFLQRAYDQILHDVCLQNLDVVFCIDRAGLVGEDGETHQGIFDIAFMSHMPNMTVLSPCNYKELYEMLEYSVSQHKGPIAIRYPRGNMQLNYENPAPFVLKKADVLLNGGDAAILFAGAMGKIAMEARDILKEKGIDILLINLRTLCPIDKAHIEEILENTKICVVLEDGIERGGVGEYISSMLSDSDKDIIIKAHKDGIVQHGSVSELYKLSSMDAEHIAESIILKLEKTDGQV